jgi:hemolysin III
MSSASLNAEESDYLLRLHRYFEWCDSYRAPILPEAAVAFRLRVQTLRVRGAEGAAAAAAAFRADALLPVMQMLRHDSCIHTLDLSGLPLADSGAFVVADGLAAGAPLREVRLEGCGIGAEGAAAVFRAAERNLHLRRLSLAHNAVGPAASGALAQLLKRTRYLAEIDVRGCSLGSAALRELTVALLERASAREKRRLGGGAGQPQQRPAPPESLHIGRGNACARLVGVITRDDRLVVTTAFRVKLVGAPAALAVGEAPAAAGGGSGGSGGGGTGDAAAVGSGGGGGGGRLRASTSSGLLDGDVEDTLDLSILIGSNMVALEVISSVIHAVGLIFTVVGAFPLIEKGRRADAGPVELLSYVIYLAGLGGWFSTALLRHSLFQLGSSVLTRLTPPAAFVLIASTYTPFLLNSFACVHGAWLVLGALWAVAVLGSAAASALPLAGSRLLLLLYLLEGYSGAALGALLPGCLSPAAWRLLLSGGACFSAGVLFYARAKAPGGLTPTLPLWYAFVLLGAALHFLAVLWHVEAPSQRCFEAAAHLGLAAGPEPGDWEHVAGSARDVLANASHRLSLAGRQAVAETLRELLRQVEGGAGDGGGGAGEL